MNHRVRVTRPARSAPQRRRTVTSEIDAQSEVGQVYVRSLIRSQLRLAVSILLALAATVMILPLAFTIFPGLAMREVLGMPLSWVLLGFAVYPWLVFLAWRYVRRSERNERAFSEVVERQ